MKHVSHTHIHTYTLRAKVRLQPSHHTSIRGWGVVAAAAAAVAFTSSRTFWGPGLRRQTSNVLPSLSLSLHLLPSFYLLLLFRFSFTHPTHQERARSAVLLLNEQKNNTFQFSHVWQHLHESGAKGRGSQIVLRDRLEIVFQNCIFYYKHLSNLAVWRIGARGSSFPQLKCQIK